MLYQKENLHGGDVYGEEIELDFSVNLNPYGTSPAVLDAIRKAAEKVCHYPDPHCRDLVKKISDREQVPASFVLCGNGAAELIRSYCQAVREIVSEEKKRQDKLHDICRAVVTAPSFIEYELGLFHEGIECTRYYLKKEKAFELDEEYLTFLRNGRPDAVFLCSPNNPDGQLIPEERMEQILYLSEEMGFRLFVDECFLELSDSGVSAKGYLQEHPHLFLLKAFTKNYGMAGVRLGYCLCAEEKLLSRMSGTVQPWNVSLIAQEAGIAALSDEDFLKAAKELIPRERKKLSRELTEAGLRVFPSQANYLLFQGPGGLDRELKAQKILIRNCDNFPGLGPGWYRICVKLPEDNRKLTEAIGQILKKTM